MSGRSINLALQGGGAHGAFTWGVLDRLLDEKTIDIAAISGTSAGALNGAALKAGLAAAGAAGARANLDALWRAVAGGSDNRMLRWMTSLAPVPPSMQRWVDIFSPLSWFENVAKIFSPYDYAFYNNPLKATLEALPYPDFATENGPRLFVSATNVRTGRVRVFSGKELTPQAVMASACLPTIFRAVEIDDPLTGQKEAFWDGGFIANPGLFPLYDRSLPRDIVIVNINPMRRDDMPQTPGSIQDRVNEISFNASLMGELRSINFVKKLETEGRLQKRQMKVPLIHMVLDDELMNTLGARSKIMPAPGLLDEMKAAGQAAAEGFLRKNGAAIGVRDSVDLGALFANGFGF